jgi:acetoacetate decarboxylase
MGGDIHFKIIPPAECSPRICELVRCSLSDLTVKGAWEGPAGLERHAHALAPVSDLPVREAVSAVHVLTDLTPGLGAVVHDYLKEG